MLVKIQISSFFTLKIHDWEKIEYEKIIAKRKSYLCWNRLICNKRPWPHDFCNCYYCKTGIWLCHNRFRFRWKYFCPQTNWDIAFNFSFDRASYGLNTSKIILHFSFQVKNILYIWTDIKYTPMKNTFILRFTDPVIF